MEMLLMGVCLSVFGLAVAVLAFGAATRDERTAQAQAAQPEVQPALAVAPARFFASHLVTPMATQPRVPLEALLLQIENHVRLEQAAAESFVEYPTAHLLHSKTSSPFVN